MKKRFSQKIVVATGGTGGHIFPAKALADYLVKNNFLINLVTDERGYRFLKNNLNYKIKIINSATIFKKNPIKIIFSIFKVIFSLINSYIFLKKIKPDMVFGMGGYSSFPICIAAKYLKIPFIIYENNLIIGKSNRYLLPYAKKLFVAYNDLKGADVKYNNKIIQTGNIIREKILNFKKNNLENVSKDLNIIILGGSQAAMSFALKLPKIFEKCKKEGININIYQQCLESQKKFLEKKYSFLNINHEIFTFSNNLLEYFSKVDLAITRSGSSMMAELLNCQIPIISIPLPSSADNHQYENAKLFEKRGYGYLIEECEIDLKLFQLIKSILDDKDLLNQMKLKQKKHSDKKVFEIIHNEMSKIINE
mgnify:FL=1